MLKLEIGQAVTNNWCGGISRVAGFQYGEWNGEIVRYVVVAGDGFPQVFSESSFLSNYSPEGTMS